MQGTSITLSNILIPNTSSFKRPTSSQLGPSKPANKSVSPLLEERIMGQFSEIGAGETTTPAACLD